MTESAGTYTITVENAGPSAATGVRLTASFPFGRGRPNPSLATCTTNTDDGRGRETPFIDCALGTLGLGTSATVIVTVTPRLPFGERTSTARVTGTEADPNPQNNSVSVTIAALRVTMTANAGTVGTRLPYTITVENAGPSPASSVTVRGDFPFTIAELPPFAGEDAGRSRNREH